MLRFFRSIRNRLVYNNKMGRYVIYAIGEIILIVIGILIALGINNHNSKKNNELASISTLVEIQNNLLDDLYQCETMANNYLIVRASKEKILDFENPLSLSDLSNGNIRRIGRFYDYLSINNNGFKNFDDQIDFLPSNFKPLLKDLRFLYIRINKINVFYSDRLLRTVEAHRDFITEQNWDLYELKNSKFSDEEINYYLNDDRFKGYIIKYETDRFNVFAASQAYRLYAIDVYNKIDRILNNEKVSIPNDLLGSSNLNELKQFLGSYQESNSEIVQKFYLKNNLLYSDLLDSNGITLESKIHRKINDSLYAYRKHLNADIWRFIKTENGQIKVVFLHDNRELVRID